MREPSDATRPRSSSHVGRQVFAIAGALLVAATLTSAHAQDQYAPRRLPPTTALYPGVASPAVGYLLSDEPGSVVFPEQRDSLAPNRLAPGAPALALMSREEPVVDHQPTYQLLRFVEAPDPPHQPTERDASSPFGDELKPPEPPDPLDGSKTTDTDGGQENEDGEDEDGEPQTYGQEPVSNSLQFLREQDVLLNPGDWQFDTGFMYTLFDDDYPLAVVNGGGDVVGVVQGRIRDRLIFSPLAFRYGLNKNVQLFSALPTGYAGTQISTVGESVTFDAGGIGDLTAGAQMHVLAGEDTFPDVIATLGFTAPTGDFNAPVGSLVPGTALGQGFWAISAQLLFINRYDPVIAFYGVGFRHLFGREFDGALFQPGEQLNYQFGVGFAANDRVTLSATFLGFFISETVINRTALEGTNIEPMSLRFAATVVRNERIVEPFAQIGMTDFAPAASFGVVITLYNHDDGPCRPTTCQ